MIGLYALHYNFCRVHPALDATPAMEAGLDEVVRDPGWIIELVDARAAKPNRPKRYSETGRQFKLRHRATFVRPASLG